MTCSVTCSVFTSLHFWFTARCLTHVLKKYLLNSWVNEWMTYNRVASSYCSKINFSFLVVFTLWNGSSIWNFYPALFLGNSSRNFPVQQRVHMLALFKRDFSVLHRGFFFLRMWLFPAWSCRYDSATFGTDSRGVGLGRPLCVKWLGHAAALIRAGYCGSRYKGNSCSHYSNSYVIIWDVRHLRSAHATKTFILLICQYICASHLSFSCFLFFFFASFHKWQNASQFSNNWLLHRNILKAAALLENIFGWLYVYVNIYIY